MSWTTTSGRALEIASSVARGRPGDGLVGLQRLLAGRERRVLRRRHEIDPGGRDRFAPPLPGLEGDPMPASRQPRPEREHRKRMARLAKRPEEDPQDLSATPSHRWLPGLDGDRRVQRPVKPRARPALAAARTVRSAEKRDRRGDQGADAGLAIRRQARCHDVRAGRTATPGRSARRARRGRPRLCDRARYRS